MRRRQVASPAGNGRRLPFGHLPSVKSPSAGHSSREFAGSSGGLHGDAVLVVGGGIGCGQPRTWGDQRCSPGKIKRRNESPLGPPCIRNSSRRPISHPSSSRAPQKSIFLSWRKTRGLLTEAWNDVLSSQNLMEARRAVAFCRSDRERSPPPHCRKRRPSSLPLHSKACSAVWNVVSRQREQRGG